MSTTAEQTPTIEAPRGGATGRKAAKVELKGQDLAERKFARKLIAPALVVAILITQIPFLATIYYSFQDWNLRYRLQSVPGVAEVASIGGFVQQYQVTVDPNRLKAEGVYE